ncbi:phage holin [Priestia megaterium]|uniref:phage holin n=1 Tax=Priestia megaterium TaxID=1404 RepID=UPI00366A59FD
MNSLGFNKVALIRVVLFLLAWINQYLVSKGLQPLPVLDEEAVSGIITFVVSVWALLGNNKAKKEVKNTKK